MSNQNISKEGRFTPEQLQQIGKLTADQLLMTPVANKKDILAEIGFYLAENSSMSPIADIDLVGDGLLIIYRFISSLEKYDKKKG